MLCSSSLVHAEFAEPVRPWPVACAPVRSVARVSLVGSLEPRRASAWSEPGADARVFVDIARIDHEVDTPLPTFDAAGAAVDHVLVEDDHVTRGRS